MSRHVGTGSWRAFCRMTRRVMVRREVKRSPRGAGANASPIRASEWRAIDPKPCELPMASVKPR